MWTSVNSLKKESVLKSIFLHTQVKTAKSAVVVSEYFMRGYHNVMSKVGMRNRLFDIEHALRLAAADGEITYEEIRQNLKK